MSRAAEVSTTQIVGFFLVATLFAAAAAAAAPPPEQQAAEILRQTGVRGGLVVHLGCGDGELTVALRASEGFVVHGLDRDASHVERARHYVHSLGLYGPVSIDRLQGPALPYVDNLVNLVVVGDRDAVPMAEILLVLAPGGVVCIREKGRWRMTHKERPAAIDEWTHFLHDASNNAVAADRTVGPPQRLQWLAGPIYARHHEHTTSVSTVVSSGGRVFYIEDEGPNVSMFMPARWRLVARDAFNGVLLWKRPIDHWAPSLGGFLGNPSWLQRMLVAVDQRIYVTLGLGRPVCELDAATGATLATYDATQGAEEIMHAGGRLFVVAANEKRKGPGGMAAATPARRIVALEPGSGKVLWQKTDGDTAGLLPLTLAVADGRVFFESDAGIVGLDASTGRRLWCYAPTRPRRRTQPPTLVVYGNVVLCADTGSDGGEVRGTPAVGQLVALSADAGRLLWSHPCAEGWHSLADVLVADGLVWVGTRRGRGWIIGAPSTGEADFTEGLDPVTGEVRRRLDTDKAFIDRPHHHRCYRDKATDRFLIVGRHGVEMIPTDGSQTQLSDWVRGTCRYGVLPCNGLLYLPPHSCCCHIQNMVSGFRALAPEGGNMPSEVSEGDRLQRGPAYGSKQGTAESGSQPPNLLISRSASSSDWPTFRHDAARSGHTPDEVPASLRQVWQAKVGHRLSAPVVAEGLLLVADVDAHTLRAVDAASGTPTWGFTASGRIDSPPTVEGGRVLFGSADGSVYCLRASDGALIWRFLAASGMKSKTRRSAT